MSLYVDLTSVDRSQKDVECHLMPCTIEYDGSANVDSHFTTSIRKSEKNDEVMTASFRGRPLEGQNMNLPPGYSGVVLRETGKAYEEEDRQLSVTHQFKTLTYWNLDSTPSLNDNITRAIDWVNIAHAIHSPIDIENDSTQ